MREAITVGMLVLLVGTGNSVAADGASIEDPLPRADVSSYTDAVLSAAGEGDVQALAEAALQLAQEIVGQVTGSVCIRGVPSKMLPDLQPITFNSLGKTWEIPAGPSSQGGGDALMVRVLQIEVDFGTCAATGIAYLAFAIPSGVTGSDAPSWIDWVNQ